MPVNKDLPSTWVKYKSSQCQKCIGTCCTMPVEVKIEDLICLGVIHEDDAFESRGKLVKRLKKEGLIQSYRESTKLFMLTQKPNGDCYFLNSQTRLCTVYENRPQVCRQFPEKMGNRVGFCPLILK
jgi:Fe-S-cluster containining protein